MKPAITKLRLVCCAAALLLPVSACGSGEGPVLPPPGGAIPPIPTYGHFGGFVSGPDGEPVADAPIEIQSLSDDCSHGSTPPWGGHKSSAGGSYNIHFMTPGQNLYTGECFRITSTVEGVGSDTILVFVDRLAGPTSVAGTVYVGLQLR
ncbi:MAG TPA: hypothetical protein PLL69_11390 [Gemmatimonadales bacterium]|nr:hypothetical protein [Gemmatimonadales bacterium]